MTEYWCEYAWLNQAGAAAATEYLAGDAVAGNAVTGSVVLTVVDGEISNVRIGGPPPGATKLLGVTIPGLVNAHSHAFHRALRARTEIDRGTFWTWRTQMYEVAARLTPDNYQALATAVFAEMVSSGITTVGEFHYVHHRPDGTPYDDANAMTAAIVDAAATAGVRLTVLETCYLHSGIDTDGSPRTPDGVQARFSDGDGAAWAARTTDASERFTNATTRVGAAIHSVRAVDPVSIEQVAHWADDHHTVLHAHVSEQIAENEQCEAAYGLSPVAVLARHGAVSDRFCAVHATHVDKTDMALLGIANAGFCMCPTTEQDLADGIGPAADLIAAGASMSLGSDSQSVIDLFAEARAVELDERLRTQTRGHFVAADLLNAATATGGRYLGWDRVGALATGHHADFVTVGLDSVRLAGTGPTLEALVFAATAADVTHVVVAGEVVVADGRHVTIDVPAALTQAIDTLYDENTSRLDRPVDNTARDRPDTR